MNQIKPPLQHDNANEPPAPPAAPAAPAVERELHVACNLEGADGAHAAVETPFPLWGGKRDRLDELFLLNSIVLVQPDPPAALPIDPEHPVSTIGGAVVSIADAAPLSTRSGLERGQVDCDAILTPF